jgi:hypothetical protein
MHRRHDSPPKPRVSAKETRLYPLDPGRLAIAQPAALVVPNALTAPAFVDAKGFASARVKHYLNDVGSITAANTLELFLSLFAGQPASTKKAHVMLLVGIQ